MQMQQNIACIRCCVMAHDWHFYNMLSIYVIFSFPNQPLDVMCIDFYNTPATTVIVGLDVLESISQWFTIQSSPLGTVEECCYNKINAILSEILNCPYALQTFPKFIQKGHWQLIQVTSSLHELT